MRVDKKYLTNWLQANITKGWEVTEIKSINSGSTDFIPRIWIKLINDKTPIPKILYSFYTMKELTSMLNKDYELCFSKKNDMEELDVRKKQ